MPTWAIALLGIGTLLLAVALTGAAWLGWKTYVRRSLMRLVVRTEEVEASFQALIDALGRLAVASDEDLEGFAEDPESTERRVLGDVAMRADLITDELDRLKLPQSLIGAANALADAAYLIAQEARLVTADDRGSQALEKIIALDTEAVGGYVTQAHRRISDACADWGLEETNVYGGGLYL